MSQDTLKVDEETGEIVEVKKNEIVAEMFTDEVLDMYAQYEYLKQQKEMFEFKVKQVCEKFGIKSVDNDYYRITFVPAHTTKKIDTELLKKAGYYEDFLKESEVKESIRVKIK